MRELGTIYSRCISPFLLTLGLPGLLAACASSPDHQDGIRIGVTTKQEVIARYGQPDVLMTYPAGETAIYPPARSDASAPRIEVPSLQVAPRGQFTTPMQPIVPGLGATYLDDRTTERVSNEIHIRYDAGGVVRGLFSP